jgi:Winged helix-turn helix
MAGVIQMSDRELTRLRVMIDLADDRLTVNAAAMLMGLGRRQIYRLRRAFSADGPAGLASRKRGRPSNRKRGESFRATVLVTTHLHLLSAICQGGSSTGFPARALLMAWRAVRPCRRPVAMTEAAAA